MQWFSLLPASSVTSRLSQSLRIYRYSCEYCHIAVTEQCKHHLYTDILYTGLLMTLKQGVSISVLFSFFYLLQKV